MISQFSFVRLFLIHRATIEPISNREIRGSLGWHGWKLSSQYVGRTLRELERKGYIVSTGVLDGRQKTYRATRLGRLALERATVNIRSLFAQ